MTTATATEVINGYHGRVPFARAEAAAVTRPRLLRGLLATARHVAELPSGAGHFLTDYAAAGTEATLIDGNPAMLAAALDHAAAAGLAAERTHAHVRHVQNLGSLPAPDLVVMPNAALNQLACQTPLAELLAGIQLALQPGVDLLAQVLCAHPGGGLDSSGFYDLGRQHGVWFADRYLGLADAARAVLRCRRQHRDIHSPQRLRVEFDYQDPRGISLHTITVELRVFSATDLTETLVAAGFGHVRFLPGHGGLSEILTVTDGGARS